MQFRDKCWETARRRRVATLEPVWDDAPAWTGRILTDRARRWGWAPTVDLPRALAEIADGLTAG